jgi:hypothetical protein
MQSENVMKAQKDLRSAILNCLTPQQQKELADVITEFATATKEYGIFLTANDPRLSESLQRANRAWHELRFIGLETKF